MDIWLQAFLLNQDSGQQVSLFSVSDCNKEKPEAFPWIDILSQQKANPFLSDEFVQANFTQGRHRT